MLSCTPKDDGNIIVSSRHQNWILKVNYADGMGDGNILWGLGEGGYFSLKNGTDTTDWAYAQHAPSFFSANTAGVFSLGVMDNGNDRIFPAGVTCGSPGAPPCLYTTVPVWQINESAKTATLTFHQIVATALYSNFGGNAEQLANSNVEYDLCGVETGSYAYEVTQESSPQTGLNDARHWHKSLSRFPDSKSLSRSAMAMNSEKELLRRLTGLCQLTNRIGGWPAQAFA
jgi:hypothetical protein